jgi:phage tail sheath protein FI
MDPDHSQIQERAYELWQQRGCPEGSSEQDWLQAESEFRNRRTPGVYITEFSALPPSVVGVQTAVPVFIGYTQKAVVEGKAVAFEPLPLSSLAEFEQYFGTAPDSLYDLDATATPTPTPGLPRFLLYRSIQLFYANGGADCYVVSTGGYTAPVSLEPLLQGLDAAADQVGPTLLVVPDGVLLPSAGDFGKLNQASLAQCERLEDRVAILDVYGADSATLATLDSCIARFREFIVARQPSYGMAYFPFLDTTVVSPSDIDYTNFNPAQPAQAILTPPVATQLQYFLTLYNRQQYPDSDPRQEEVQGYIAQIDQTAPHGSPGVVALNNTLAGALPAYAELLATIARLEGVLPPSGAMAGIYTVSDAEQGVWNAPANLSVACAISPTLSLNDSQQGDLTVPLDGKAINVIRNLVGRGPVVWGSRTLDGNSLDWRYIQVRRTIVYVEQSIKNALNQFVFAANDAQTWTAVVSMISGFLQGLWARGGLMGDKASDAYTVNCGVPQTMTAEDIFNGYMIVSVTLQLVHPAEYIELTFKQTMQGS